MLAATVWTVLALLLVVLVWIIVAGAGAILREKRVPRRRGWWGAIVAAVASGLVAGIVTFVAGVMIIDNAPSMDIDTAAGLLLAVWILAVGVAGLATPFASWFLPEHVGPLRRGLLAGAAGGALTSVVAAIILQAAAY